MGESSFQKRFKEKLNGTYDRDNDHIKSKPSRDTDRLKQFVAIISKFVVFEESQLPFSLPAQEEIIRIEQEEKDIDRLSLAHTYINGNEAFHSEIAFFLMFTNLEIELRKTLDILECSPGETDSLHKLLKNINRQKHPSTNDYIFEKEEYYNLKNVIDIRNNVMHGKEVEVVNKTELMHAKYKLIKKACGKLAEVKSLQLKKRNALNT